MRIIEIDHLTKYYGNIKGIEDVCLSVDEGDFFGLFGPAGSGKSTTIKILLGLIFASSGRASIRGKEASYDRASALEDVGYLPPESMLHGGIMVKNILEYCARMRKKECKEEARRLCERLGLDMTKKVDELSDSSRKKVALVCALQHDPKIYILDEPTSSLDNIARKEFYSIMKEKNKNGATIFMSSHLMPEAGKFCRNAAIIREGSVLASDSVERLVSTGVKRVFLRSVTSLPKIENARDIKFGKHGVKFLYKGSPSELLAELSRLEFDDFTITDPDLDEIFLHFYSYTD